MVYKIVIENVLNQSYDASKSNFHVFVDRILPAINQVKTKRLLEQTLWGIKEITIKRCLLES